MRVQRMFNAGSVRPELVAPHRLHARPSPTSRCAHADALQPPPIEHRSAPSPSAPPRTTSPSRDDPIMSPAVAVMGACHAGTGQRVPVQCTCGPALALPVVAPAGLRACRPPTPCPWGCPQVHCVQSVPDAESTRSPRVRRAFRMCSRRVQGMFRGVSLRGCAGESVLYRVLVVGGGALLGIAGLSSCTAPPPTHTHTHWTRAPRVRCPFGEGRGSGWIGGRSHERRDTHVCGICGSGRSPRGLTPKSAAFQGPWRFFPPPPGPAHASLCLQCGGVRGSGVGGQRRGGGGGRGRQRRRAPVASIFTRSSFPTNALGGPQPCAPNTPGQGLHTPVQWRRTAPTT